MEKHYINHTEFAAMLNLSNSTLIRRQKDMDYTLPRGMLGPEDRAIFIKKLAAWEEKRREQAAEKKRDVK